MLSRVLHPESNRIGLALLREYLRSFGETYLDLLFFSPGASFEIFTVLPLWEKKIKKSKRYFELYTDVSFENRACFSSKSRPKLILRKLECVDIFQNDILKKWQAALDASPEMNGGTSRKAGPIRPFAGSKHTCEGVETSISAF